MIPPIVSAQSVQSAARRTEFDQGLLGSTSLGTAHVVVPVRAVYDRASFWTRCCPRDPGGRRIFTNSQTVMSLSWVSDVLGRNSQGVNRTTTLASSNKKQIGRLK